MNKASEQLQSAIATVPAGRWAVGVSGGADSIALLALLRNRNDLKLHVVHLDHQTRGQESTGDAQLVQQLAAQWKLPSTAATREQIEPLVPAAPSNPPARYRALRLELYRQVIQANQLQGVLLAHHADDQAETTFQRLLRSASYISIPGMNFQTVVDSVTILRPLLACRRQQLRDYLKQNSIPWREDQSNDSDKYLRNQLRKILARHESLHQAMLNLSETCDDLRAWVRQAASNPGVRLSIERFNRLPRLLAEEQARRWLADQGVNCERIEAAVIDRLLNMAGDAASSSRQDFPDGLIVRRRAGEIFNEPGT
ncbi:MAG TPA: tRNA lysidine(34) synthetase TilS [Tepidisphaeraceae bacterium]|nr:tRNA lysidine(34) synthetase TilS [Tepidisphaeraceae bacterium]